MCCHLRSTSRTELRRLNSVMKLGLAFSFTAKEAQKMLTTSSYSIQFYNQNFCNKQWLSNLGILKQIMQYFADTKTRKTKHLSSAMNKRFFTVYKPCYQLSLMQGWNNSDKKSDPFYFWLTVLVIILVLLKRIIWNISWIIVDVTSWLTTRPNLLWLSTGHLLHIKSCFQFSLCTNQINS